MKKIPDTHRDLLEMDVAALATIGPKGHPQVTAIWFLFDDDGRVKLSLNTARQKVKNLKKRPECTFFIIDPANQGRTLEMRADAKLVADDDYAFANKLAGKYGLEDLSVMDKPGETRVMVILEPVKINVLDLSA
ncbi:MAG TPA: TIGR03618 family F420-dependent PPOX class oxidoreductase [Anaerolineae bacterium]|nr:TIGR03618 family F420-dependent PPOX class oxidoreductase [Anaerolineae bacterium]